MKCNTKGGKMDLLSNLRERG